MDNSLTSLYTNYLYYLLLYYDYNYLELYDNYLLLLTISETKTNKFRKFLTL